MVKFNGWEVRNISEVGEEVEIIINGNLFDGRQFEGYDQIKIIHPP